MLPVTTCDGGAESWGVLDWFIAKRYSSSRDDPERGTRRQTVVWNWPRVVLGACVLLFLAWCVWWQFRTVPVPADVFRESEHVHNPSQFPESVRQDMRRLLQMVPESICGVAAPNVRVYRRFMMLRLEGGLILEVFNPEILRSHQKLSRNVTIEEESLMCKLTTYRRVGRMTSIYVRFDDSSGSLHERHLAGVQAVCVQHFMDVFDGAWPCDVIGDEFRIPVAVDDVVVVPTRSTPPLEL